MKKIISEKLPRVVKNRKKLEKELKVKISNRGKEVFIEGKPEDEYYAEKVIDALDFGFPFEKAMALKDENFIFEILSIKDYTKRKDLEVIKSRIIGKGGKSLKVLHELTKCDFEIKENKVGIVGNSENIENAQEAVIAIIRGAKHANVYAFLEKRHSEPVLDLGLK